MLVDKTCTSEVLRDFARFRQCLGLPSHEMTLLCQPESSKICNGRHDSSLCLMVFFVTYLPCQRDRQREARHVLHNMSHDKTYNGLFKVLTAC